MNITRGTRCPTLRNGTRAARLSHHHIQQDATGQEQLSRTVDALRSADLLFVSVRRRTPPTEQMNAVRAYLRAGKPLVGIRTACHAFALRPTDPPAEAESGELGRNSIRKCLAVTTRTTIPRVPGRRSPLPRARRSIGFSTECRYRHYSAPDPCYKVSPLESDTTQLLIGTIPDQPAEPIAWTHRLRSERRAGVLHVARAPG